MLCSCALVGLLGIGLRIEGCVALTRRFRGGANVEINLRVRRQRFVEN